MPDPQDEPGHKDPFGARLAEQRSALPPACRRVADYIDRNRAAVLASSAMDLAAAAGTSDATVIRAVQALGFSGLGTLKQALLASVEQPSSLADDMRRTLGDVGQDIDRAVATVFEAHEEALDGLRSPAARERIAAAVSVLHRGQRIAVFGIGPSAALAAYVVTLLTRTGRRSLPLNVTGAMLADQLLDLRSGDVLLVLAYGRAYPEVVTVLDEARRLGLPIVLVTDSLDAKPSGLATIILSARRGRAEHMALHGATLVCLEALVLGLAAVGKAGAITALDRLQRLRNLTRGRKDTTG